MRMLGRWFRHRSRVPRGLRAALALVLGTVALFGIAAQTGGASTPRAATTPAAGAPTTPAAGAPTTLPASQNGPNKATFGPGPGEPAKTFPSSPALIAEGYNLYEQSCSSCHGLTLHGIPGRAPALIGVGPGPVDFYLATGRMPLADPYLEPERARPAFTRSQINAIIAYIASFGGPPAPTADPANGNLATGYDQFTLHCAGCHQVVTRGGMLIGAWIPNLQQATAQQVAEAVRIGPYMMPHFDSKQINQYQLDSIAKYVLYTQHPDNAGGWAIYNLGPIPEGMVAWLLGLAALVIVARLIGERNDEGLPSRPSVPNHPTPPK